MYDKLRVLTEVAKGRVAYHPVQNAAVLKVPDDVIRIVTPQVCALVDADLVEAAWAPIQSRWIPLQMTELGWQALDQGHLVTGGGLGRGRLW